MKKYRLIVFIATILLMLSGTISVHAEDDDNIPYYITAYHIDIDVAEDNVLSITEDIDVYFNEARHGIYRSIPKRNEIKRADGSTDVTRAKINDISCSDDYTKSTVNSELVLQIGDPDTTITGDKHYTISYRYALGQDVAEGYDEFYFNIIGTGWDTYIDNVSFSITMPKEFDMNLLGFSTGSYGTAGTDTIEYAVNGLEISGNLTQELMPGEAFTVRLELEEGYFYFNKALHIAKISAMILIPLICLIFVLIMWLKYGKDKKIVKVVEFYPPEGMNSADVSYWYKGSLPRKDLVALLIELANDGYIIINDIENEKETKNANYSIERIKQYPDGIDENKKLFFDGLFESGNDIVTIKDLENKFYKTLNKITENYRKSSNTNRIHSLSSTRKQLICWLLTIICLIFNFVILYNTMGGSERFFSFVVGLLILAGAFWLSCYVSKRTDESHEYLEKISGFKMFLEKAEKDKLEMLVDEDPKYFYNILPYAYVLGVSDKWVDKFKNITIEPPEWYSSNDEFNTAAMWYAMNRNLNQAASAMTTSPSQSSSDGGGGVSGGGSGGGGGGSW